MLMAEGLEYEKDREGRQQDVALFDSLIKSAKLAGGPRAHLGEAARRPIRSPGAVKIAHDLE